MRRRPPVACLALVLGIGAAADGPALVAPSPREQCEELNREGSFAAALPHCLAAEATQRDASAALDDDGGALGGALTSLGLALEMTGDRAAARDRYLEALARHRRWNRRAEEALVLSNLAALSIGGGDYRAALDWLDEEESVARRALAGGAAAWAEEELGYVRINRSVALEQLGAYSEALAELKPLARGALEAPPGTPLDSENAALLVNLAVLYRNLGDPRRALRLLDRARTAYERLGDEAALANVHLNRALVQQLNLRSPQLAAPELEAARRRASESGDRGELVRILTATGELQLALGDLAAAESAFDEARRAAIAAGAAAGQWAAEAGLARVARAAGDPIGALAHLRAAIAEIERVGGDLESAKLQSDLLSDQRTVYAAAVDLLAEAALAAPEDDREESALAALEVAEKAKARELLATLNGDASQPLSAVDLAALRRELGPTLVYFFGEHRLWRWELHEGRWSVAAAGEGATVARLVSRVHRQLSRSEEAGSEDLDRLAELLLPAGRAFGHELRIVPDGRLFYLPFEILRPQAATTPIVATSAVTYLPSLSVFAHLRPTEKAPRWTIAALADPLLPVALEDGAARSFAGLLARRSQLPPLPGAEHEARAAALLGKPAAVDTGAEATEERLRMRAAEGARVLHIAAHTVIDEELAGGVALFLAESGPDEERDGLVTPAEIARLPLQADLAVLSACRTAIAEDRFAGGNDAGRGLASLSGAFLGAGAQGVVASLWEVSDAATAVLMERFYERLARGDRPAEALRRAKWAMAQTSEWGAAPAWSGFVLLGSPRPVLAARFDRTALGLGGAGFAAFAAAWLLWRSVRSRN